MYVRAQQDPPIRLVLVSREYPPFYGGGIGTYARWIVPALIDAGVRVTVITEAHDRSSPRVELQGPLTIHRVPLAIGRGGWTSAAARFSINAGRKIAELTRRGEVDLAEFAECEAAAAALLLLRGTGPRVPTLVHLHTPSEMLYQLRSLSSRAVDTSLGSYFTAERLAIRLADRIGAPSQFIASWAHHHYALPECPHVIPYAIAPPADPPPPSNDPNVLFIGRIEPRKGVESLIRAWIEVRRQHPDAMLRLAGADTASAPQGGSMRAYLQSQLSPADRQSVQFLGRLRPEALASEYAQASICVIPSLWENFPNTCIESMTHARPVVVSDNGGMAEMVADTDAGFVFTAGDPGSLQQALSRILDEPPSERARRGKVARQRIFHMCDPARVAAQRIELFQNTIARCRSRNAPGPIANDMIAEWCRCEDLLRNDTSCLDMPELSGPIAQWIEPVAAQEVIR